MELIGEFNGSGCVEVPYLLRRADGQMLTVSQVLYRLVAEIDGQRGIDEIADNVSARLGRTISPPA